MPGPRPSTPSTGASPSGSPAGSPGKDPLSSSYLAESLRADFSSVTVARRAARRRRHRPPRARSGARAGRRPRHVGLGQRAVDAATARTAHRPGRRTDGRQPGGAVRAADRRHRDRCAPRISRATCARPVRPARPRRGRCVGCRLLRGRQHPGVGEAVRVPAARLPLVDRDPRVHAPRAVHRGVVDEALLPLVGRRDAVVDRPRSSPSRASARRAPPRSCATVATHSTTVGSSRSWQPTSSAARSRACSRSCRCSKVTATAS